MNQEKECGIEYISSEQRVINYIQEKNLSLNVTREHWVFFCIYPENIVLLTYLEDIVSLHAFLRTLNY